MSINKYPHKRFNPLTGEWILVSPHRAKRPWQGKVENAERSRMPEYDPECYLCPGSSRAGGIKNPKYNKTYVFDNDFSALLSDIPGEVLNKDDLLCAKSEKGICRVICFSPKHNLTIPLMKREDIKEVILVWIKEYEEISALKYISYVQIFENRGEIMGCSNPHPHCQIWANETVPVIPAIETEKQMDYFQLNKKCLLCDYIKIETAEKERIVIENDSFIVLVPFWAVWPFEVMILPKFHAGSILNMKKRQITDLSDAMKKIGIKFDNLFLTSFPYSMGFHQSPIDENKYKAWHFHIHYYPPLLRSAMIKKFMVGYEMLAMAQRDITAEESACRLREISDVHYLLG